MGPAAQKCENCGVLVHARFVKNHKCGYVNCPKCLMPLTKSDFNTHLLSSHRKSAAAKDLRKTLAARPKHLPDRTRLEKALRVLDKKKKTNPAVFNYDVNIPPPLKRRSSAADLKRVIPGLTEFENIKPDHTPSNSKIMRGRKKSEIVYSRDWE